MKSNESNCITSSGIKEGESGGVRQSASKLKRRTTVMGGRRAIRAESKGFHDTTEEWRGKQLRQLACKMLPDKTEPYIQTYSRSFRFKGLNLSHGRGGWK